MPDNADIYYSRAIGWEDLGREQEAKGNIADYNEYLDKAIADYDRAIEIDPKFSLAYENRQKALDAKEKSEKGR